jgi:IclR family KDG regulon transcriptional repressor
MVDRDPGSLQYRIGWQLFVLAARGGDQRLVACAAALLVSVVAETGERSHLSVLRGPDVLTVLTESPSHALQSVSWVGRSVPCHATASGRALLLDHDRDRLAALLGTGPLDRYGPNCPVDVDDLAARIEAARPGGAIVVDEELEAGLVAVSAPVRDSTGRIVAALGISGPEFRLADRIDAACSAVAAAAADLSQQLGWKPTRTTSDR